MSARQTLRSAQGQSILEFTIVVPIILFLLLGVVEFGYAVFDQQVVTRLTREGSNLISRDVTIQDTSKAMINMSTRPVNFNDGSRLILSVLKRGSTTGTANYDKLILYQRYEYGTLSKPSKLQTTGGSYGGAPDYVAVNSDTDTRLRLTNVSDTLITVKGGMLYVTEIFSTHKLITPFDNLGVHLPETLYSIAYF